MVLELGGRRNDSHEHTHGRYYRGRQHGPRPAGKAVRVRHRTQPALQDRRLRVQVPPWHRADRISRKSLRMIAAWYDRPGPAAEVLQVGELPAAEPGPGEVRIRLSRSGANPGDMKKRQSWLGNRMAFPRIIPHSDGAGVIEAVGPGADPARLGGRVWVYGAQSYRPFGTAAQTTVVPDALAVDLPDAVSDETGACLGIPGITAHRAVFADGPVSGQTVLVHGVRGAVASLAAQLARWGGATVIGTVRTDAEAGQAGAETADHVVSLASDPVSAIRRLAPDGVDRVVTSRCRPTR